MTFKDWFDSKEYASWDNACDVAQEGWYYQQKRIDDLECALKEIADNKTFNHYDCADRTEEVYDVGKSLVQTARDVLKEGE